jgi:hypothetical protein
MTQSKNLACTFSFFLPCIRKATGIPGIQQGVLNARNVKQVENIARKVNEQKRISKDDIYNLVLLTYHMEGYIHEVTVFPDLTAVIANALLDTRNRMVRYILSINLHSSFFT